MNKDTRGLLAVVFLTAAVFLAMGRIVESAPLGDWGLALLLAVIGAVLALSTVIDLTGGPAIDFDAEENDGRTALPAPKPQTVYEFAGAAAPQLQAAAPALAAASVNGTAQAAESDDLPIPPIDDVESSAPVAVADLDLDGVSADEPAPPPLDDDRPVSPTDDTERTI